MKFTKMHGIGNDYIYVNAIKNPVENPMDAARILSDRHFGVGSDGLVLIEASNVADFRMQMHNSDGSEAQMCGNAIRCVGKYVYDRHLTDKTTLTIETKAGIKVLELKVADGCVESVTVDMGEPILEGRNIPIKSDLTPYVNQPITVDGKEYRVSCVSMGNPHAVVYVEDVKGLEIETIGPCFETHPLFPQKTNTEFVRVLDRHTIEMRVWERGAGETLACGTGACATLVATVLNGFCDRSVTIKLLGGDLFIRWDEETGHVFMTGPAAFSFDGVTDLV